MSNVRHSSISTVDPERIEPGASSTAKTKHPRRDLASYFPRGKCDRIPVLRVDYRSPGQLKRAVD